MTEIGDFLGMNRESVRRRFQRMGARPYLREDLPPLTDRKEEFNQLEEIEENERVYHRRRERRRHRQGPV